MLDLQAVWDLAVAACIKNLCPNTSADCLHLAEASNLKSGVAYRVKYISTPYPTTFVGCYLESWFVQSLECTVTYALLVLKALDMKYEI